MIKLSILLGYPYIHYAKLFNVSTAGLVVCFLNVHPFGASVDSIVSYLKLGGISVDTNHVTSLLDSFPNIFFPKISGLGVDFEKLWTFNGFSPIEKT